ncbi:MAG: type III-B CRISPR module-associated Cmr3 family protein [Desulfobacterales bacterium]
MKYKLTTDETLILRDGRPFGETGVFGGNSYNWPFAQTIAGMARTKIGFSRDPQYFTTEANADDILKIGISKILPLVKIKDKWTALLPAPADLILTENDEKDMLTVHPLIFKSIDGDCGTDIANRQWLIPTVNLQKKPAKEKPFFFHWNFYQNYLKGGLTGKENLAFSEIGISPPVKDIKIHNAIDRNTLTTQEGKLFSNAGFFLKSKNKGTFVDLSICFEVINADAGSLSGEAYLGGERKRVTLSQIDSYFPDCPDYFKDRKFLKLILTTHGDFGSWCPKWLIPDLNSDMIQWIKIPDTGFEVKLRSACIAGWDSVSGWDYKKKESKAMKKLVPPGSVYLIEIQNNNQSAEIAEYFWGNSLDRNDTASLNNGYGQCIVGNATVNENI